MEISLTLDIEDLLDNIDLAEVEIEKSAARAMKRLGIEAERHAKETIAKFINSSGREQGVDTGHFVASIRTTMILGGKGFILADGVPYGIYHEFGTIKHWVPFFDVSGNITSLGEWALRHFDFQEDSTFKIIGKSGKPLKKPSRLSRIDKLKAMGGIKVSLDEMAPFRKAIEYIDSIRDDVFREEFEKMNDIFSNAMSKSSAYGQATGAIGMGGVDF